MPSEGALAGPVRERTPVDQPDDLGPLFHRLNNQLGIILANAELLEAKLGDHAGCARAGQIVTSVLDAMGTAKEIRLRLEEQRPGSTTSR